MSAEGSRVKRVSGGVKGQACQRRGQGSSVSAEGSRVKRVSGGVKGQACLRRGQGHTAYSCNLLSSYFC